MIEILDLTDVNAKFKKTNTLSFTNQNKRGTLCPHPPHIRNKGKYTSLEPSQLCAVYLNFEEELDPVSMGFTRSQPVNK